MSVQVGSESILGVFERENRSGETRQVVPFYEYLRLDVGGMDDQSVSLHMTGWIRTDTADGEYYEETTDGELLQGYLSYVSPEAALSLKLGRQHLYSGIIDDSLDGIGLNGRLGPYLSVFAAGGYPTAYQEENGTSGDGLAGLRIAFHPTMSHQIGLSYKSLTDDGERMVHAAGADISMGITPAWFLSGLSSWNLETSGWQEHAYEMSITFYPLVVRPFYQYVQYEDYFIETGGDARPFHFLQDTGERLTIAGAELMWQVFASLEAGAKFKHYDYDRLSETSRYTAGLINIRGRGATASGIEAGFMDGDQDVNRYRLLRGFIFWDAPFSALESWFVSGDVTFVAYDQAIYNQDRSLYISIGTGKRFGDSGSQLEVSGSYSADPYFDSDFRMMMAVRVNLGL